MTDVKVTKDGSDLINNADIECGECKRRTKHVILESYTLRGEQKYGRDMSVYWTEQYQIIQCNGCETISFRKTHRNSEELEQTGPEEFDYATREFLFPSRVEGRPPVPDLMLLPSALQAIYEETLLALNSSQPILTGIGLRALIESVCKDKNAKGSDLFEQINDLVAQGVLTKDGAEILHKLRVLGNTAAHKVKPHESVQLNLAMDVVDHLLLGVYVLPHHAKKTFK